MQVFFLRVTDRAHSKSQGLPYSLLDKYISWNQICKNHLHMDLTKFISLNYLIFKSRALNFTFRKLEFNTIYESYCTLKVNLTLTKRAPLKETSSSRPLLAISQSWNTLTLFTMQCHDMSSPKDEEYITSQCNVLLVTN